MLVLLLPQFSDYFQFFNLFRYLTFRSGGAVLTALAMAFFLGPYIIKWLKSKQAGASNVREDTPETHQKKQGTPSMGGSLILLALVCSSLLWADLSNGYVWLVLGVTIGFGLIGFADDYLKLTKRNSKGLSGKLKLLLQGLISLAAALAYTKLTKAGLNTGLTIPMLKGFLLPLGWWFIPFAMLVMVGSSNAVNLTDGLDGLATVPVMITAGTFAIFAYLAGNFRFADYLQIVYLPGSGELAVICGAILGSGMGFLWYNAPPAQVFMGDTGSLSLGGAIGSIAVVIKQEIVLVLVGGLFVLEALSVIIQVISFRTTGKRIFAMAPLHHHFEKKGWAEATIVVRFWIIAAILALAGLATLKIR